MSDTRYPTGLESDFDGSFDKELIQMWQENTYPLSNNPNDLARRLSGRIRQFDRRIFWRNMLEYSAGVVVLVRSAFDIASGERLLFAPLTSIAATLFILSYIWRQHRSVRPLDPSLNASAYRTTLMERLDRQIRLARSVGYWYVLPAWIFFLTVLASGILKGLPFIPLLADFLSAAALGGVVIWLNKRYGARSLEAERARIVAINTESNEN